MRTTKRFTPDVLRRFELQERGTGIESEYRAWHQVSRGDPASSGRSHLLAWRGRHLDLLSDIEWVSSLFAIMLRNLTDLRPQFPLSLDPAEHELSSYTIGYTSRLFPGTRELALQLGIKHPKVRCNGETSDWIPTTDLLLTLRTEKGPSLLAVADKPSDSWNTGRKRELLRLEAAYWQVRGVEWLLITPAQYIKAVGLTLRRTAPWALGRQATDMELALVTEVARTLHFQSERRILETLAEVLGDMDHAQCALWQAIWSGQLPIALDRGWRNHLPLRWLDAPAFLDQNPIASRRSAWN